MLYYLFENPVITRALLAFALSLTISLVIGSKLINFLRLKQGKGQPIREDGPQSHLLTKKGTPTMGGIMILGTTILSILFFCDICNPFVLCCLAVIIIYGLVGFRDDYVKVKKQTPNAMTAKMKLLLQFTTALAVAIVVSYSTPEEIRYNLSIPYFKHLSLNISFLYIPFAMIVITGASNAVNLSDGLDGLASGLAAISFFAFAAIASLCGFFEIDFNVFKIPGASEISIVCMAVVGACLGFMWFNAPPAKIFMGDVGSLALGALIGTIAVITKAEILLAIIGGVFVVEALSVMIQVFYFKKTGGKRFFKMAPIHHHFEQLGWAETTVVYRFHIIAIILSVLGLIGVIF